MGWHSSRPMRKGIWKDVKWFFYLVPVWLVCNKVYRGTFGGDFVVGKSTTPVIEQYGLPYDPRPRTQAGFVGTDEAHTTAKIRSS